MKNKLSKSLLVPVMAVIGLGAGLAGMANAQSITTSSTTATPIVTTTTTNTNPAGATTGATQSQGSFDPSKGGHTANGKTEELLTGDTATKVTAAALAAVPGGTIQRVETDADGAVYEAHMLKADGTQVTVTFDANYTVVEMQTGGPGGHGPRGAAPSSSTTTQ